MKNRKKVLAATLVALAFAFAPVIKAAPRPDGGPTAAATSKSVNANSEAGAQSGMQENILPLASISFAPVGLTFGQTARLNLVNMDVAIGITVSCRFMDASGVTLAQSVTTLSLGKIASVDFKRGEPPPGESLQVDRCERKLTSSPTKSRATVSVRVWKSSTTIPAQRRCIWAG